ncbi:MAG TPA: WD40 repeat domain-containing protein [Pyrinomonadaceae bacterium]|nr:WD40 repeat domain-containing protein [Pyrinomonadaceae bacterium]
MANPEQNPFLGLKPYEPKDRQRLYGRDKDLFLMKDRIFSCRTTLLFAASGVGKTSFINAKIIPDLEGQYSIIYHNQWSIGDPLGALEKSIAAKAPEDSVPDSPESLLDYLSFTKSAEGRAGKRCLIVLDQFEEIFQYHSRQKYFERFIDEIASIINSSECNARVLFSMREEFLGELSIFDNKIPDLFNNYYRLKCPTKVEAEEIIERTCSFVKTPVSSDKLAPFVFELTLIDKADLAKDETAGADTLFERDIIAPPFLQIACQRLWERQYVSSKSANGNKNGDFLTDYKKGDAHSMLRAFCHEILATFNHRDRALLADAFDFLVTKKGAKMAYELSSLAEHMSVKEDVLKSVLQKLSLPEKRILRETNAPNESLWFELYHDMYGPIIDEWKRAYRAERAAALRRKVKRFSAAGLVIVLFVIGLIYVISVLREYEKTLADANLRDPVNYATSKAAFDNLHNTWGFGWKAKRLWSDAWKRRASLSERTEFSDDALLSWLRAAAEDPRNVDPALTAQINSLLTSDDYQPLMATYRLESDGTASGSGALFSADGKRLLGITKDLRVISYEVGSNQPVGQSQPLDLTRCKSRSDQFNEVQQVNALPSSPVDQGSLFNISIRSAAGNLIAGVNGNNVCVWDVESGELLFPRETREITSSGPSTPGGYGSPQASISVSPDGNYFATINGQRQGALYKVKNKTIETLYREPGPVESILFSPDKRTVLFDQTSVVKLLDLDNGAWKTLPLNSHRGFRRIIFNSDGSKLLVKGGLDEQSELWDLTTGSFQKQINAPPGGPYAEFYFCGTNLLALVDKDRMIFDENREILTITLLNTDTNSVISTRTSLISKASYKISSSQSAILIIPASGIARLLTLTPRPPGSKVINDPEGMTLRNISDDGRMIATVNQHNVVKLWNADDVTMSASFQLPGDGSNAPPGRLDQLLVSATGKYLFYARQSGRLIVWDNQQQRQILEAESNTDDFGRLISYSADDRVIAITGPGKNITLWQDGRVVQYPLKDDPSRIELSRDGRYLTAIYDYSNVPVRLFDLARAFFELRPPLNVTQKIAWAGNGTLLAPTANDNELLVWNLPTYVHHTLKHSYTVTALALSGDGTRAVTSTSDRNLHLWDTTNGTLITSGKLGATIRQLSLSNDGKSILAASDTWIHLYSIQAGGLEYVDGRLIGIRDLPRILDNTGQNLRLVVPLSNDSLEVDDISFAPSKDATLPENPKALLETWQRKLSLNFDERGALAQLASGG